MICYVISYYVIYYTILMDFAYAPRIPTYRPNDLPTTYYLLPITYYLLPIAYYLLPVTYYLLPITYCSPMGLRAVTLPRVSLLGSCSICVCVCVCPHFEEFHPWTHKRVSRLRAPNPGSSYSRQLLCCAPWKHIYIYIYVSLSLSIYIYIYIYI